jgi:hypothetical protein
MGNMLICTPHVMYKTLYHTLHHTHRAASTPISCLFLVSIKQTQPADDKHRAKVHKKEDASGL